MSVWLDHLRGSRPESGHLAAGVTFAACTQGFEGAPHAMPANLIGPNSVCSQRSSLQAAGHRPPAQLQTILQIVAGSPVTHDHGR